MQLNPHRFRKATLFWAYFIGLGAVLGAAMFFIDPSGVVWGMEPILPLLKERLPFFESLFGDFIASGIALFLVAGLPNIISAILTHKNSRLAVVSNVVCAIMLILWVLLEFYIWGLLWLSVVYLIFGVLQLFTSLAFMRTLKTT